ncbi:MAG: hypothetical protein DLM60_23885 [Pseudonocardiales bacterium]|nr:MAG: hypothetical protein DLM60_23885 [Pseudonocardiales bacterium]
MCGIAAKRRLRGAAARDQAQATVRSPVSSPDSPSAATDARRLLVNGRRALRRAQSKVAELGSLPMDRVGGSVCTSPTPVQLRTVVAARLISVA